jgi:putative flippase GtrA
VAVQGVAPGRRAALIRRLPGVAGAGGAAWIVDVTILWVGHVVLGVATPLAAAAGFLASGVVNYTLNRRVFAATDHRRLRRYLVLFGANLVIVSVAVPLLASALHGLAPGYPPRSSAPKSS